MSVKRKKRRHSSLPGIKSEKIQSNRNKETNKLFFSKIKKIQQINDYSHTRTTSSPIGLLRKATSRALALRNQFIRSRSSNHFGESFKERTNEIKENNLVKNFKY